MSLANKWMRKKIPSFCNLALYFLGDEDDADTGDDSILDVNNDQMFDDTIFTEYNDQNLSVMSNKMTKKWRKKWEKEDLRKRTFGAETIDRFGFCVLKFLSILSDFLSREKLIQKQEESKAEQF